MLSEDRLVVGERLEELSFDGVGVVDPVVEDGVGLVESALELGVLAAFVAPVEVVYCELQAEEGGRLGVDCLVKAVDFVV